MDAIYLRRFNRQTPESALFDEKGSLLSQINDTTEEFLRVSDTMLYSQARALASKLASLKAKLSYIERMLSYSETCKKAIRQPLFPRDYYGSLEDVI